MLIIVPHPDDEIIGLGGYLLKNLQKGGSIHLIYLTDGEGSDVWADKEEIRRQRLLMSENVFKQLGVKETQISRLHLPDGAVPRKGENGFEEAVNSISKLIDSIQPDAVFATSLTDYWPYDHVACSELAIAAVKSSKTKPALWFYWVWTWYHLRPWNIHTLNFRNLYKIDIHSQLKRKKELMDVYLQSFTPDGKPWSGFLPKGMLYPFTKPIEIIEKYEWPQTLPPNPLKGE